MDLPQADAVSVAYALLPGFLAAWIFYGLTAHRRKGPFERIIEALIFTTVIQVVLVPLRATLLLIGQILPLGLWTQNTSLVLSVGLAVGVGMVMALFANKDWFRAFLRDSRLFRRFDGITKRTSYPTEWFSTFSRNTRYVVLHMVGERRLYGWPLEWPDHRTAATSRSYNQNGYSRTVRGSGWTAPK